MKSIEMRQSEALTYAEARNVAMKRIKSGRYLLRRHGGWFRPNAAGYTRDVAEAGIYTDQDARGYIDVEGLSAVPLESVLGMIDNQIKGAEQRLSALRALRAQIAAA